MKNLNHLLPDPISGLSKATFKTELYFTDHDVVVLTLKIYNEDYDLVFEEVKEMHTLQDCINEMARSLLEQYIWDNEK